MDINYTLLEIFPEREGHRCGYCQSQSSNFSDDIYTHFLTVQDYQDLIDRGWRRCGKSCYKPTMNKACCPQYTIRCDAQNFSLSKSQKKIIKRLNKFLSDGKKPGKEERCDNPTDRDDLCDESVHREAKEIEGISSSGNDSAHGNCINLSQRTVDSYSQKEVQENKEPSSSEMKQEKSFTEKTPAPSITGRDPTKPLPRKAKLLRIERKQKKMAEKGLEFEVSKPKSQPKSLEDFLHERSGGKHSFELRLVRSHPPSAEFQKTFNDEFSLYKKYQINVHKDELQSLTPKKFHRFLVESPFVPVNNFGSYHQQYWLDGHLIAVAVVDILPYCVSSVYFFYDVDYSFLSLGTYSSFRELELVRSLNNIYPDLKYYYMGYYIHTCQKMRYKANIRPAFILCPEIYSWHSAEEAVPKIERSHYTKLNDDPSTVPKDSDIDLNKVLVFWNSSKRTFAEYLEASDNYDEIPDVELYSKLVGATLSQRMVLFRPR